MDKIIELTWQGSKSIKAGTVPPTSEFTRRDTSQPTNESPVSDLRRPTNLNFS